MVPMAQASNSFLVCYSPLARFLQLKCVGPLWGSFAARAAHIARHTLLAQLVCAARVHEELASATKSLVEPRRHTAR